MSEEKALLYEQFGRVVKLTINRPTKRNAMNHAVIQGLQDAFDKIAEDDSVSVVVIGGAGEKAFTAGFDLKESAGANITDMVERRADTRNENKLWLKMWNLHKPIITMIHGYTIGGGITIAIADEDHDAVPIVTAAGLTKTMAPRSPETIKEFPLPRVDTDIHDYYKNIAAVVNGEATQIVTHDQQREVMRLMEAIFESAENNKVVKF